MATANRNGTRSPPGTNGKARRIDIGAIRREQIVDAAMAIIADQGLPKLSLSAIERRTQMSRGQLTYYFPSKEAILLAVFDRLLQLMYDRLGMPIADERQSEHGKLWTTTCHLLQAILDAPASNLDFHALQYSFLAQVNHRADYRQRLAGLYAEWRQHMAADFADERHRGPAREMASLIQAILHGLSMQLLADPEAFDRHKMLELCKSILGSYLGMATKPSRPAAARRSKNPRGGIRGMRS